jgi:hypothetical protein
MSLLNKMNPEIKQKWVDALRSGEYSQSDGKLRSHQGFCCLGVLCDLYSQEPLTKGWKFKEAFEEENTQAKDYWYFDGESEFLPESVKEWAGLGFNNPQVKVELEEDEEALFYFDEIANLNDAGYTFPQLANIIEDQF